MGHCSRSYNDRPDFRAPNRGTPNIGWTIADPYRSAHYATSRDVPYRPPAPPGPGRRPPYVPIAPVIVIMIVVLSSTPSGLVLLPLLVFGLVTLSLAGQGGRRRRWEQRAARPVPSARPAQPARPEPPAAARPLPAPTDSTVALPTAAGTWPSRNPVVSSPFEKLAFWDEEPDTDRSSGLTPLTPPAWDPLGVAPFAWDLPEPPPLNPPRRRRRPHLGAAKLIFPTALLAAMLATAGDFAGWWPLDWAAAATSALAVVVIALLAGTLRQRVRR